MRKLSSNLRYFINSISNYHSQSQRENIVIFSTPRNGSTWLMELISSQPGFKYYDEPLNIRKHDVQKTNLNLNWCNLLPDGHKTEKILSYLEDLQKNRYKFMNPTPLRRNHRFFTNRIVYKIHEVEHLINEIKTRLKVKIIFLLRHPIANTLSRNVYPRLEYFISSEYVMKLLLSDSQAAYAQKIYQDGDKFEKGILSWCLQNIIPLNYLQKKDWIILTYEELVINSDRICKYLHEKLQLPDLEKSLKVVNKPAHNLNISNKNTLSIWRNNDIVERKKQLIKKWYAKVTQQQIDKAFEIITVFEIDAYKKGHYFAARKYINFRDTYDLL